MSSVPLLGVLKEGLRRNANGYCFLNLSLFDPCKNH